ncbi:unnamed protein product [Sphenostylis stenocarpa]|uniref:Uncharacterized protein n=1 Tax=Sphenostylis stenocarpa TaxID=92480 RepID=A0AA86SY92_9FABA|nr:unnamed protein product [Sphenostylis stenocarpa]
MVHMRSMEGDRRYTYTAMARVGNENISLACRRRWSGSEMVFVLCVCGACNVECSFVSQISINGSPSATSPPHPHPTVPSVSEDLVKLR